MKEKRGKVKTCELVGMITKVCRKNVDIVIETMVEVVNVVLSCRVIEYNRLRMSNINKLNRSHVAKEKSARNYIVQLSK